MRKSFCNKCSKLEEAAIISHMHPDIFQGVVVKCEIQNAYCVYYRSQVHITIWRNRNKERVIAEYKKKSWP